MIQNCMSLLVTTHYSRFWPHTKPAKHSQGWHIALGLVEAAATYGMVTSDIHFVAVQGSSTALSLGTKLPAYRTLRFHRTLGCLSNQLTHMPLPYAPHQEIHPSPGLLA